MSDSGPSKHLAATIKSFQDAGGKQPDLPSKEVGEAPRMERDVDSTITIRVVKQILDNQPIDNIYRQSETCQHVEKRLQDANQVLFHGIGSGTYRTLVSGDTEQHLPRVRSSRDEHWFMSCDITAASKVFLDCPMNIMIVEFIGANVLDLYLSLWQLMDIRYDEKESDGWVSVDPAVPWLYVPLAPYVASELNSNSPIKKTPEWLRPRTRRRLIKHMHKHPWMGKAMLELNLVYGASRGTVGRFIDWGCKFEKLEGGVPYLLLTFPTLEYPMENSHEISPDIYGHNERDSQRRAGTFFKTLDFWVSMNRVLLLDKGFIAISRPQRSLYYNPVVVGRKVFEGDSVDDEPNILARMLEIYDRLAGNSNTLDFLDAWLAEEEEAMNELDLTMFQSSEVEDGKAHNSNPVTTNDTVSMAEIVERVRSTSRLRSCVSTLLAVAKSQYKALMRFKNLIFSEDPADKVDIAVRELLGSAGRSHARLGSTYTSIVDRGFHRLLTAKSNEIVKIERDVVMAKDLRERVFQLLSSARALQQMALAKEQAQQQRELAELQLKAVREEAEQRAKAADEQLIAAKKQAQDQAAIAERQLEAARQQAIESRIQVDLANKAQEMGKSVLVFTIVTTVFLPLSFFTSYFGMNTTDIRDTNYTQAKFWMICGPVTVGVVAVALGFAFYSRVLEFVGLGGLAKRGKGKRMEREEEIYQTLRRRHTVEPKEVA